MSPPSLPTWVPLLAFMFLRHYGWTWAPANHRGEVSKAIGAMAALGLLWLVSNRLGAADKLARWALILYAWHEASVALCATWFVFDPWTIAPGQGMCSAKIGFELGALGLLLVAALASRGVRTL